MGLAAVDGDHSIIVGKRSKKIGAMEQFFCEGCLQRIVRAKSFLTYLINMV
jgi:hypothetical protein